MTKIKPWYASYSGVGMGGGGGGGGRVHLIFGPQKFSTVLKIELRVLKKLDPPIEKYLPMPLSYALC